MQSFTGRTSVSCQDLVKSPVQRTVQDVGIQVSNGKNLPKEVINICSKETRWVEIEIGYTGWRTEVVYQYREIKPNKPNCRLISGWKHVVKLLEIHQGDRVYFEGRSDMSWLLRVSRDKHPDAVKVEDEYWA
ncbi:hypothetical protein C2S52_014101 [Perilla frutescens var. hirtella]|nr:hypothetical protein C2S52_014101 [Perilla frutescens var. hirtella]